MSYVDEIIEKVEVKLSEIDDKNNNDYVDFSDLALGKTSSSTLMTDTISKNSKVIADNIQEFISSKNNIVFRNSCDF